MIAEILARHGMRHRRLPVPALGVASASGSESTAKTSAAESVRSGRRPGRAVRPPQLVERSTGEPDDPVTQFEALTAAAYSELARRGVQVAVIEAGLGGRYDATNVIPSKVAGADQRRPRAHPLAGADDHRHRRREARRRAAGGDGGARRRDLHPEAIAVARTGGGRARGDAHHRAAPSPGVAIGALGAFQRRNFALARAAAQAYLGELDEDALTAAAAAAVRVPGRLQKDRRRARRPTSTGPTTPTASAPWPSHCPSCSNPSAGPTARTIAVVSILDDKDATAMLQSP